MRGGNVCGPFAQNKDSRPTINRFSAVTTNTMPLQLHVHMLPALVSCETLANQCVVVVDVLRATTTIAHALAAKATAVIPCLEIEDAWRIAREMETGQYVLGGERFGLPIDGFHLGNSPSEYTPQTVSGKTVIFTTTNGTRAVEACRTSGSVLFAAFVNLSAVCQSLAARESVHIVCAGTRGEISAEDVLLAGALADQLAGCKMANDQATLARDAWRAATDGDEAQDLVAQLKASRGGRNLIREGLSDDIDIAAQIDLLNVVPLLNQSNGRIEAA